MPTDLSQNTTSRRPRRTPAPCKNCGKTPKYKERRKGYCAACYRRWDRAGRLDRVPDRKRGPGRPENLAHGDTAAAAKRRAQLEQNLSQFRQLLADDLPVKAAARRVGVSPRRGQQYRRILIDRGLLPGPSTQDKENSEQPTG